MITERHLFRLFVNEQIQVPTLLHSLAACLDTCEDEGSVYTSFMLLVLMLQQNLQPVKLLMAFSLKVLRSSKVSEERKRFLCVMLLRYISKRYMDFLSFDDQMAALLKQLFSNAALLSKTQERISERIAIETEELARVLSASPYSYLAHQKKGKSSSPTKVAGSYSSRFSEGVKTDRSTNAGSPSPQKPRDSLSLLNQLRRLLQEVTEAVPRSLKPKVAQFAKKKVQEIVQFSEQYDTQSEFVVETYLNQLYSALGRLLSEVRKKPQVSQQELQTLLDTCSELHMAEVA